MKRKILIPAGNKLFRGKKFNSVRGKFNALEKNIVKRSYKFRLKRKLRHREQAKLGRGAL